MAERKQISKKTRFEVFKRDSFTCQYCGKFAPNVVLEVDHIKPVAEGGTNEIINLITSCMDCNRGKGKRELSDDTIISKQKEQLDELNKRREQLEMMVEWKNELLDLKEKEVDEVVTYIQRFANIIVTEFGIKNIKKWLKDFSFSEITDAIEISFNQYSNPKIAFDKIPGICFNKRREKADPMFSYKKRFKREWYCCHGYKDISTVERFAENYIKTLSDYYRATNLIYELDDIDSLYAEW